MERGTKCSPIELIDDEEEEEGEEEEMDEEDVSPPGAIQPSRAGEPGDDVIVIGESHRPVHGAKRKQSNALAQKQSSIFSFFSPTKRRKEPAERIHTGKSIDPKRAAKKDHPCTAQVVIDDAPLPTKEEMTDHQSESCTTHNDHSSTTTTADVPYELLACTLMKVVATKKRLEISSLLTNLFHQVLKTAPHHLAACCYLVFGRVLPNSIGQELNVGGRTVMSVLREILGVSRDRLSQAYRRTGDLGDAAAQVLSHSSGLDRGHIVRRQATLIPPARLTIGGVYADLVSLCRVERGAGVQKRRKATIASLIRGACAGPPDAAKAELTFIVRFLVRNMRIGASANTILSCLARASSMVHPPPPPQQREAAAGGRHSVAQEEALRRAYSLRPDLGLLCNAVAQGGVSLAVDTCLLLPGQPIKPMLAKICRSAGEVIRAFESEPFIADYKYDGMRALLHVCGPSSPSPSLPSLDDDDDDDDAIAQGASIRIYSRNTTDITQRFPDVVMMAKERICPRCPDGAIIDGEIVAIDPSRCNDDGKDPLNAQSLHILSFQALSRRPRKLTRMPLHSDTNAESLTTTTATTEPQSSDGARAVVHVAFVAFDVLFWNGTMLIDKPLEHRRKVLLGDVLGGEAEQSMDGGRGIGQECGDVHRDAEGGRKLSDDDHDDAGEEDRHAKREKDEKDIHVDTEKEDNVMGAMVRSKDTIDVESHSDGVDDGAHPAAQHSSCHPRDVVPPCRLVMATHRCNLDESDLQSMLQQSLSDGCEGLMCKRMDSRYVADNRCDTWQKLKADYTESLGDTIDVVVIGGWRGSGRKVNFISPFLLAIFNPESEEYESLCRCMSGFSDAFYKEQTERYLSTAELPQRPSYYTTEECAGWWFRPLGVWEVLGAELSLSPKHRACCTMLNDPEGRGLSLRFPRFIRLRTDKGIEETTTPTQLYERYAAQSRRM